MLSTSKFILTLETLNEADLKAFEQWLKSPWCNSNKTLLRLLEHVRKYYPACDSSKLTKERVFQKILHLIKKQYFFVNFGVFL